MKSQADDWIDVYDQNGRRIGRARRSEVHGNPALIHRTVHVVVADSAGRMLLQKRPLHKDTQPGRWDTAVGGHLDPGEDWETAAHREMNEELGAPEDLALEFLFDRKIRNEVESEDVRVYLLRYDGPFHPDPEEIDEVRFWTRTELEAAMGTGILTPSLEEEIRLLAARRPDVFEPLKKERANHDQK